MINKKISWIGLDHDSIEQCELIITDADIKVSSHINAIINNEQYNIEYLIRLDKLWQTVYAEITRKTKDSTTIWFLEKRNNNWFINDSLSENLKRCIDIDISLTPLTNSLPIRRLNFDDSKSHKIEVVYIDIIGQGIRLVEQCYSKITNSYYLYENEETNFQAKLEIDSFGLIVQYPKLFTQCH